jgi:hypothetical protein
VSSRPTAVAAVMVLAVALTAGCGDRSDDGASGATASSSTSTVAVSTTASTTSTAVEPGVDPELAARDRDPLPPGAVVRYQSISRSPDPRSNHRWVLHENGDLFLSMHTPDTAGAAPFDTPYPAAPTRRLPASEVAEIKALMDDVAFFELPAVVAREGEGGRWQVVTARDDGREHEVVFDRAGNALVDRLGRIASER